ncbi:HTH-type transcriptional repressor PurR [Streptomyces avidinii]
MLRFPIGQAYLWQDGPALTLIDAGHAGSAAEIERAIRSLGAAPERLERIVLTHCHRDHVGAAAELAARWGAQVLAHRLDAPVIRGELPVSEPVLLDWEVPLYEQGLTVPEAPPTRVDRELEDGDALGRGTQAVGTPGRPAGRIEADVVLSDSFGGARGGVAHLIAGGHRRIGFIGDQPHIHTVAERLRGYREAMADAGLPVAESWVSLGSTTPERVAAAARAMLTGPEPVTAVFAGNNRVTVTVVRILAAHERPVALVGFDDFELADLLRPGVTVVAQDPAALGRVATAPPLPAPRGSRPDPSRIELPTRLIPGGLAEIPPAN